MCPTAVLILVFYSAKKKQPGSFELLLVSHIVVLGLNHVENNALAHVNSA